MLEYVGQSHKRGNEYQEYRADGSDCQQCAHQKQCCPRAPEKGRQVSLLEKENEAVAKFRQKMASEEAQAIYRRRGAVAEFPFAEIKERVRLRKFRVFGKAKAELEALWACLTHNVMIWCRWQRAQQTAAVAAA